MADFAGMRVRALQRYHGGLPYGLSTLKVNAMLGQVCLILGFVYSQSSASRAGRVGEGAAVGLFLFTLSAAPADKRTPA